MALVSSLSLTQFRPSFPRLASLAAGEGVPPPPLHAEDTLDALAKKFDIIPNFGGSVGAQSNSTLITTTSVVVKKPPRKVGPRPWFTHGGKSKMLVSSKSMGSIGIGKALGLGKPFTMNLSTASSSSLVGVGKMMLNDGLDDDRSIVGSGRARIHSASRNRWQGRGRSRASSSEDPTLLQTTPINFAPETSLVSSGSSKLLEHDGGEGGNPATRPFVTRVSVPLPAATERPEECPSPSVSPRSSSVALGQKPMTPSSRLLGQDSMVEGSFGGDLEAPPPGSRQRLLVGQREITLGAWSEREEHTQEESLMFRRAGRSSKGRRTGQQRPRTGGNGEKKTRLMERLEKRSTKGLAGLNVG
jgi:hypothetical protein